MKIGIVGLGVVGNAVYTYFKKYLSNTIGYDKYKNIGNKTDILDCNILFLCLPTLYNEEMKEYDKSSIYEVCNYLSDNKYNGLVVLKSTIEPETSEFLSVQYNLKIVHNPEFLSANTAVEDFENQTHIVLGKTPTIKNNDFTILEQLYIRLFPNSMITILDSKESELMKIGVNTFYAIKIQYFNELYLLSNKLGISYEDVKNTMLKNGWINPMHTMVPGTDGKLSYGGMCFPKDTNALNEYLKRNALPHNIIESTINEQKKIRNKPIDFNKYLE